MKPGGARLLRGVARMLAKNYSTCALSWAKVGQPGG